MSRRSDILLAQLRALYIDTREAKKVRDDLRDNYVAKLDAANALLDDLQAERDDALIRLNTRLVAEGQPEITLASFKEMP